MLASDAKPSMRSSRLKILLAIRSMCEPPICGSAGWLRVDRSLKYSLLLIVYYWPARIRLTAVN